MGSPALTTKRTLRYLRDQGFHAEKTEQQVPRFAGKVRDSAGRSRSAFFLDRRRDLFGGIDIVALKLGEGLIGVQSGAAGDHAKHRKKMLAEPALHAWLEAGLRLWIISWRKSAKRGQKRELWRPRIEELRLDDFPTTDEGGTHAQSSTVRGPLLDADRDASDVGSASANSLPSEAGPA